MPGVERGVTELVLQHRSGSETRRLVTAAETKKQDFEGRQEAKSGGVGERERRDEKGACTLPWAG